MAFASRPNSPTNAAGDNNAMQDLSGDASTSNTLYSETASTIRAREWTAYQASLAREQEQMYGLFGSSSSSIADHAATYQSALSDRDEVGHARRRTDSSDMGLAGPAGMGPDPAAPMQPMYSGQDHTDHLYALTAARPLSRNSHTELVQDNHATIRQRVERQLDPISSIEAWMPQEQLGTASSAQVTGSLGTPAVTLSPAIDADYQAGEGAGALAALSYDQTASDSAGLGYILPSSSMLSDHTARQLSPVSSAIPFDARSLPDMPSGSFRPATAGPPASDNLEIQQEQQRFRRSSLPEGTTGGFEQAADSPYLSVGESYGATTAGLGTYRDVLSPALSSTSESPSRSPSRAEHDVPSSGVSSAASASGASATGGQPLTPEQQYHAHYISYYTAQGYSPADAAIAASAAVEYYCGPSASSSAYSSGYAAPTSISTAQYSQAHPHIRGYSNSSSMSGNSGSPSMGYVSETAYYASPHTRTYTYGQHGTPATPATTYSQAGHSPATYVVPANNGLGDITYEAATGRYLRHSPTGYTLPQHDSAGAAGLAGEANSMAIHDQSEDRDAAAEEFGQSPYMGTGPSSHAMVRGVSSPQAGDASTIDMSARGLAPMSSVASEQDQHWYRAPQGGAGAAPNPGLGIYGTALSSGSQHDSSGPATATAGSFFGSSTSPKTNLQVGSAAPHLLQPGSAPPTSGEFRMSDYPFANPYAYSSQPPAGTYARSPSTLRVGKKPSNGALARSTSLTSATGGRVKRKKAPATAAPKSPRLSASAFRFHQLKGLAADKLPLPGAFAPGASTGGATYPEDDSLKASAGGLAPIGRVTRARQKLAACPSTSNNSGLFQLQASASAPAAPYTSSTDAATGSDASKSVSPPAAGPYLGPINLISAFEPGEVYDANTPLHLLPTKRSRGRRPVGSNELDVDPSIASTTASTYSQLAFSGVTKTGRPKKIFVCRVPGCDRCFKRQEHLNRHIRSLHTNEKPWPCEYPGCKKTFARSDNLDQHIKNIHRDALKLTKRRAVRPKQEGEAASADDDREEDEAVEDMESSNGSRSGESAKFHTPSIPESSASPSAGGDADMQGAEARSGEPESSQETEPAVQRGSAHRPRSLHEYHLGQAHQHQQYAYNLGAPLATSEGAAASE